MIDSDIDYMVILQELKLALRKVIPSKEKIQGVDSELLFYDLDHLNLFERAANGDERAREILEEMIASNSLKSDSQ